MKKVMMMLLAVAALCSCSSKNNAQQLADVDDSADQPKVLVAYFSASGTTKAVAEKLASVVDADLFEIEPEEPYTDADLDWRNKESRSSIEMANHDEYRTEMKYNVEDIDEYGVIYLGFPIWWNTTPTIVNTFIEANALDGKTVIPFCTSGTSTIEQACADLQELYPDVEWQPGKRLNDATDEDLEQWVNE